MTTTPPPAPGGKSEEIIYPSQPPKDPILVLVLNLLVAGGVGYLMMGQKTKGIVAIVLWIVFLVPPSCGTLSGLLAIAAAIDGYLQAQHLQAGHPIGQWTFFKDHR
jgi:hypothetical protein